MKENFNTITVMDYALNEIRVYRNGYKSMMKTGMKAHAIICMVIIRG